MELICDNEHWSCCYSTWSKIKNDCVKATFAYIQQFIKNNTIRIDNEERRQQIKILEYIDKINAHKSENELIYNSNLNIISGFLDECKHIEFIDLLVKFGVSGLYALCYKCDCEGYYSVGNAYDICDLFSIIHDFTLENNFDIDAPENIIYRSINQIERVFQESLQKKRIVSIF